MSAPGKICINDKTAANRLTVKRLRDADRGTTAGWCDERRETPDKSSWFAQTGAYALRCLPNMTDRQAVLRYAAFCAD